MKNFVLILFVFFVPLILVSSAQEENEQDKPNDENKNELVFSDEELITGFTIAIMIVIGIFLYLARDSVLRKKNPYDAGNFESKKDKDYEKYHSDWHGEDENFYQKKYDSKDEEEQYRNAVKNSSLPDYYDILGVSIDATQDKIKNQYRQLAKQWHPDKKNIIEPKIQNEKEQGEVEEFTPTPTDKMSEINKAYEVLSDKERREKYDKYRRAV